MNSHIHGLRRSGAGGKVDRSRGGFWRKGFVTTTLCGGVVLAGGCNGPTGGAPTAGGTVAATTLGGSSSQGVADEYYLIGPLAARDLGYRIDWQQHTLISANSGIKNITVQGDSVFVLDGRNFLSRGGTDALTVSVSLPDTCPLPYSARVVDRDDATLLCRSLERGPDPLYRTSLDLATCLLGTP